MRDGWLEPDGPLWSEAQDALPEGWHLEGQILHRPGSLIWWAYASLERGLGYRRASGDSPEQAIRMLVDGFEHHEVYSDWRAGLPAGMSPENG